MTAASAAERDERDRSTESEDPAVDPAAKPNEREDGRDGEDDETSEPEPRGGDEPVEGPPPSVDALVSPVCIDVWTCVGGCGESCEKTCNADGATALDYEAMVCDQSCRLSCKEECCGGASYAEHMSFLAGIQCIESACADVSSDEVQPCLWQNCPEVYSHCLQPTGDDTVGECKATFGCMLDATRWWALGCF